MSQQTIRYTMQLYQLKFAATRYAEPLFFI